MRGRADRYDAGAAGRLERRVEAGRQREVAEVVGRELQLPAVGRVRLGRGHHAGVVDEEVQRAVPALDELGDRLVVGELEVRGGYLVADLVRGLLAGFEVANRDRDLGAGNGQRSRGLDPDPGRAAGHDGALAGEIDALDDLG